MASGFFAGYGWRNKLWPHLAYHLSRISVYVLFGVIGSLTGRILVQTGIVGKAQGVMLIVSGSLIILIGIWLFVVSIGNKQAACKQGCQREIHFDRNKSLSPFLPVIAGLLNGFVPCSLVFSVTLKAVASADPVNSGMLMLFFGLGTVPTMAIVTTLGAAIGEKTRGYLAAATGLLVILLGGWTFYEGWFFFDIMRGLAS